MKKLIGFIFMLVIAFYGIISGQAKIALNNGKIFDVYIFEDLEDRILCQRIDDTKSLLEISKTDIKKIKYHPEESKKFDGKNKKLRSWLYIREPAKKYIGKLWEVKDTSLLFYEGIKGIDYENPASALEIPYYDIEKIKFQNSGQTIALGILLGAIIGGTAGGLIGANSGGDEEGTLFSPISEKDQNTFAGAGIGIFLGGIAGGIISSSIKTSFQLDGKKRNFYLQKKELEKYSLYW